VQTHDESKNKTNRLQTKIQHYNINTNTIFSSTSKFPGCRLLPPVRANSHKLGGNSLNFDMAYHRHSQTKVISPVTIRHIREDNRESAISLISFGDERCNFQANSPPILCIFSRPY